MLVDAEMDQPNEVEVILPQDGTRVSCGYSGSENSSMISIVFAN
jgi:hypothetical protein